MNKLTILLIVTSIVILIGLIFLPHELKVLMPIGFFPIFALYGGLYTYNKFTVSNYLIKRHSDLLKQYKIEYYYTGLNPHINLKEVSVKLENEPLPSFVFKKIKNQKTCLNLAIASFILFPLSALLLFIL